ncbi:SWR1-complex protein 5 [Grifola frondosa]|uniref:SWR1-complex protein 5 n=1 Tax=Grifola frondosa TaxID=5627 RepID=A0A1C7MSL0_GRIFR|nr:SWR1-complex protein 5 [Grifola frondosa]
MPPSTHSDSDDDQDYVPPPDAGSDDSDSEKPVSKRARTSPSPPPEADRKCIRTRDELWAEFQASVAAAPQRPRSDSETRMVKIEKRYRFAGEDITEVKEVPADSQEAKQWPLWNPPDEGSASQPPAPASASSNADAPVAGTSSPSTSASATPVAVPAKPPARRVGPRKSKTILAPLPKKQSAKKLTTLDKSAMDWRAHLEAEAQSGVKDELEANRRGGGYLEKVEFLQRVEARKEDILDTNKGKRRR